MKSASWLGKIFSAITDVSLNSISNLVPSTYSICFALTHVSKIYPHLAWDLSLKAISYLIVKAKSYLRSECCVHFFLTAHFSESCQVTSHVRKGIVQNERSPCDEILHSRAMQGLSTFEASSIIPSHTCAKPLQINWEIWLLIECRVGCFSKMLQFWEARRMWYLWWNSRSCRRTKWMLPKWYFGRWGILLFKWFDRRVWCLWWRLTIVCTFSCASGSGEILPLCYNMKFGTIQDFVVYFGSLGWN